MASMAQFYALVSCFETLLKKRESPDYQHFHVFLQIFQKHPSSVLFDVFKIFIGTIGCEFQSLPKLLLNVIEVIMK